MVLTSKDITRIHLEEHRPLTLKECNELLDYRRKFGDLTPEYILKEQQEFFKMIQRKLDYEKNIKMFQDIGDLYKLEEDE